MGGKRSRFSAQGSIRKKRKSSSKQTLSRVVERKAAAEERLQQRLEKAENATRGSIQNRKGNEQNIWRKRGGEMDTERELKEREYKRRKEAYGKLVKDFAKVEKEMEENNLEHMEEEREEEREKPQEETPTAFDEISLERENAAAVGRERKHFDPATKPVERMRKMQLIANIEGIGKVVGDIPDKIREQLVQHGQLQVNEMTEKSLGLQPSVYKRFMRYSPSVDAETQNIARAFIGVMRQYSDLFVSRRLTPRQEDHIRRLYVAHCLSHTVRCRTRVTNNDSILKENAEMLDACRDQGFSRARVLILVGMKNTAYDIVKTLIALVGVGDEVKRKKDEVQVANKERFEEEFGPGEEDEMEFGDEEENKRTSEKGKPLKKPLDHRYTFRGNVDDDLKLGISLSKKSIKLYADFYASDIIIASPLGLRRGVAERTRGKGMPEKKQKEEEDTEWKTGIGSEGRKKQKREKDDDGFLSSIEICVIDGAHILSMQNWDSLVKTMEMVNKMPIDTRDTDFSRVREWCLDGEMKKYRQTLMIGHYRKAEMCALVRGFENHSGRVDIMDNGKEFGWMGEINVKVRHTFVQVDKTGTIGEARDLRFEYFMDKVIKMVRQVTNSACLVVVPNYFDYVRVRNGLLDLGEDDATITIASMCEYSKGADISRARGKLYDGSTTFVLMTERFHFFWRHWLRGIKMVVWYQLPENGRMYSEIGSMMKGMNKDGQKMECVSVYDEFDEIRLQQVVGRRRGRKMLREGRVGRFLFA